MSIEVVGGLKKGQRWPTSYTHFQDFLNESVARNRARRIRNRIAAVSLIFILFFASFYLILGEKSASDSLNNVKNLIGKLTGGIIFGVPEEPASQNPSQGGGSEAPVEPSVQPPLSESQQQPLSQFQIPELIPEQPLINETEQTNQTQTLPSGEIQILSEDLVQQKAEINLPVKWILKIKLDRETSYLSLKLPKDASNIRVKEAKRFDRQFDITGATIMEEEKGFSLESILNLFKTITGLSTEEIQDYNITVNVPVNELELEYETPAPTIQETLVRQNPYQKQIKISSGLHYTDVFSYTSIPESNRSDILFSWIDSGKKIYPAQFIDANSNSKIDRLEWLTDLSDKTFQIDILGNVSRQEFGIQAINTTAFSCTGSVQNFTVPANVYSVSVKMWGAGGATIGASSGGAGGFSNGTFSVTPGENISIIVGCKGNVNSGMNGGAGGFGGGGNGGYGKEGGISGGGGGGGKSEILASTGNITAGAGGGGSSGADATWAGGAGGGVSAENASNLKTACYGDGSGGGAGIAGVNGTGGVGGPGGCNAAYDGVAGNVTSGGRGGDVNPVVDRGRGGGGGGGGYGGGGGGGGSYSWAAGAGGGGAGRTISGGATVAGVGTTPGNSGDSDRGTAGNADQNGKVIITINPPTSITTGGTLNITNEIYILQNNIDCTGICFNITANNITINCQSYSITGHINASNSTGLAFTNLNIKNCNASGNILATGGSVTSGSSFSGGNVTITNSIVLNITTSGGATSDPAGTSSGKGGSVVVTNSTTGTIRAEGGGGSPEIEGTGGAVTITNSTTGAIIASAGQVMQCNNGGTGGAVTITNSNVTSITTLGGGPGVNFGGHGGSVIVTNSTTGAIVASGQNAGSGLAGNGGALIIINSKISTVSSSGGGGGDSGGWGGNVTLVNSTAGTIYVPGGGGYSSGKVGGSVTLNNSNISSTAIITTTGGGSSGGYAANGTVIFRNSSLINSSGIIKFDYVSISKSPNNFASISLIKNNLVSIDSVNYPEYNVGSNVTLLNTGIASAIYVLRNGVACSGSICSGLTNLGGGNWTFRVTGWTNYSIESSVLTSCKTSGWVENTTYFLDNDVISNNTCMNITANNMTLDCQGHSITYAQVSSGVGVNISNYNFTTIKNCNIVPSTDNLPIYINAARNIEILNNTINAFWVNVRGMVIEGWSSNIIIKNNLVNVDSPGLFLESISSISIINNTLNKVLCQGSCNVVVISNNTFTDYGGPSMEFHGLSNSNITNNKVNGTSFGSGGPIWGVIYFGYSGTNIISDNNIIASQNGIYIDKSGSITVKNNTINAINYGGVVISESDSVVVANNTISVSNGGQGLRFGLSATYANIINNKITTLGTGIEITAPYTDSNNFTNNIINTTGGNGHGILLGDGASNIFTNNTIITSGTGARGIYISVFEYPSSLNKFINNTVSASGWDVYSDDTSYNNIFTNLMLRSANVSFTSLDIALRAITSGQPADSGNLGNIGKYLNITNLTSTSWIFANMSYSHSDLGYVSESTLKLYRFNSTSSAWEVVSGSGVNTTANYVYGNITSFSIFAPMGELDYPPLIDFTAPTLSDNTITTNLSAQINISITNAADLNTFIWNWNITNYTFYNDSLVMMMNFDNVSAIGDSATKAVDISKYGINGTISGAVWNSSGKYGSALTFDGVDDFINVGNMANLDIANVVTVEAWIKTNSSAQQTIFNKGIAGGYQAGYWLWLNTNGELDFYLTDGAADIDSMYTTSIANGVWHHVVGVRTGNTAYVYVDGVQQAIDTQTGFGSTSTSAIAYIGARSGTSKFFNGSIDEVMIWNRSLSAVEVQQHYISNLNKYDIDKWQFYNIQTFSEPLGSSPYTYYGYAKDIAGNVNQTATRTLTIQSINPQIDFTAPTPPNGTTTVNLSAQINISITNASDLNTFIWNWNITNYTFYNDSLVLMYNFDNVSVLGDNSTYAVDLSRYGNNGTFKGTLEPAWTTSGRYGFALSFDGVDDYVFTTKNLGIVGAQPRTVLLWFKPGDKEGRQDLYSLGTLGTSNMFNILYDFINEGLYFGSYADDQAGSLNTITRYAWNFIATTYDGTTVKVYINGNNVPDISAAKTLVTIDSTVYIGKSKENVGYTKGVIDEFAIYNRSMSVSEIQQHYYSNLNKYDTDKWAFYSNQSFTEPSGNVTYTYFGVAKDIAGNSNQTETRTLTISGVSPLVDFTAPTSANNTITTNLSVQINISITNAADFAEFKWNWNTTNYTFYNDSLVLMMNFDNVSAIGDNATHVKDVSKYGNNGTISGAVWNRSGKYGSAVQFTSSTQYINLSNPASLVLTSAYTLEAWVYLTSDSSANCDRIIAKAMWGSYLGGYDWCVITESGYTNRLVIINQNTTGQGIYRSTTSMSKNQWHHIAVTFGGNQPIFYVDNVPVSGVFDGGQTSMNNPVVSTINAYIGNHPIQTLYAFPGLIDEVRIYNRSMSAAEIKQHYYSNLNKYTSDRWVFYSNQSFTEPLNNASCTYFGAAKDTTGNSNQTATRTLTILGVPPLVDFTAPTLSDYSKLLSTSAQVNISITNASDFAEFKFNWNGVNYTMYNDSLMLMYNFDNYSIQPTSTKAVIDVSKYGNNGTNQWDNHSLSNTAWTTAGKYGNALSFNGVNSYTMANSNISLAFADESVTVTSWFNATADGIIFDENGVPTLNNGVWHDSWIEILSNNHVWVRVWNLGGVDLGTASFGQWHSVALRYNKATLTLDGFLDGVKSVSSSSGDRAAPWESGAGEYFSWGGTDSTNLGSGKYFSGVIDEGRVWNRALNDTEIIALNSSNTVQNRTGLVGEWHFDENTGTTTYSSHNLLQAGKYGEGVVFNGLGDYISVPISNSQPLTISFWMKANTLANQKILHYTADNGCGSVSNEFSTNSTNAIIYYVYDGGTKYVYGPVLDTGWHHVAATGVSNGNLYLYVDGVQYGPTAIESIWSSGDKYLIAKECANYYNGAIDELRFWNRILSADEVKQHYYSNLNKYASDKWQFYSNQSNLTTQNYTFFASAKDNAGNENMTAVRTLTITALISQKLSGWLPDTTYVLANNVSCDGTCFNIDANNVTIDCQGYKINYSQSSFGYGINVTGYNLTTIKNCNIVFGRGYSAESGNAGVYLSSTKNTTVFNNSITSSTGGDYGIYSNSGSYLNITKNTIFDPVVYGQNVFEIYLSSTSNSTISENNITTTNTIYDKCIYLTSSSNSNTITNNNITSNAQWSGSMRYSNLITLSSSNYNIIQNNNLKTNNLGFGIGLDSASYSNITANIFNSTDWFNQSRGIYVTGSTANSNIKDNIITSTGKGLHLASITTSNIFINNTITITGGAGDEWGNMFTYGIYLDGVSNNQFINTTAFCQNYWDFYSEGTSQNNTVTNLYLRSANISFTFQDIALRAITSGQPADTANYKNIGKYLNITNNSASSWAYVNISYNDIDLGTLPESSLKLYRYNSSNKWQEVPGSNVSIDSNYVYGNITSFSIFAPMDYMPMNISFVNPTPADNVKTSNLSAQINISLTNIPLGQFTWNWNGTNYAFYNESLMLMYNFDNVSAIGDNATKVVDVSTYSNNGTIYGSAVYNSSGKYGSALQFDGINDCINTSSIATTTIQNVTFEAWVNSKSASQASVIMHNGHTGNNGYGLFVGDGSCGPGNKVNVLFGGITCDAVSSTYVLSTNTWTHLVLTRNSTTWSLYANGDFKHSGTANPATPAGITSIGGAQWCNANLFNGTIDEVRIYNRSMSAAEIKQHYISNLYKYDTDKWQFYSNQTTEYGNYTYYGYASDNLGNSNQTATRTLTSKALASCKTSGWTANDVYYLAQNVNSSGTCMTIDANNVTLDCQGYTINYSQVSAGYGVNITNVDYPAVKNCNIILGNSSVTAYAIIVGGTASAKQNPIIYNNTMSRGIAGTDIQLFWTNNANISNNVIKNGTIANIFISGGKNDNLKIIGNSINTTLGYGIIYNGNAMTGGGFTITNNVIYSSSSAIFVSDISNFAINYNILNSSASNGIQLGCSINNLGAINVNNNNITSKVGLNFIGPGCPWGGTVSNNIIKSYGGDGMQMVGGVQQLTVSNNNVTSTGGSAINIGGGVHDNNLNNNIISSDTWDFSSGGGAYSNTVRNLTLGNTNVSFIFTDIALDAASTTIPADSVSLKNISKYVNITNNSATGWIQLNLSYDHSNLGGILEFSLKIYRYNSSNAWQATLNTGVDTTNDIVYGRINATTGFSIFAPMGESSNLIACKTSGWVENSTYTLGSNVNSSGACFKFDVNNITLDCQGYMINYSQVSAGVGVNFTNVNYPTVKNCNIVLGNSSAGGNAIVIGGTTGAMQNPVIYNNTIDRKTAGVDIDLIWTNNANISQNTIKNGSIKGGYLYASYTNNNLKIIGNNINTTGISIDYQGFPATNNFIITGNTIYSSSHAISLAAVSNITINYNILNSSSGYGFYCYVNAVDMCKLFTFENNNLTTKNYGLYITKEPSATLMGGTVKNNIIKSYAGDGIYLSMNANQINITSNDITSITSNAIKLDAWSFENNIFNNTLQSGSYGIRLESGATKNNIINNTLSNNIGGVLFDSSSHNILTGNTAINNSDWDFKSQNNAINNTVTNFNMSLIVSFNGRDISLRNASSPAADSSGYINISKYLNITNNAGPLSWAFVNISYNDSDIPSGVLESSLKIYRYNATSSVWKVVPGSGVNITANYVYGNITSFSIFAPMGEPPSSCQTLNTANQVYTFNQNVNSSGTCFTITANNVTIDCAGYMINYSQSSLGYGVYVNGNNFATIKNCRIIQGSSTSNAYGAYLSSSNNNQIINSSITLASSGSYGVYLTSSSSNQLINMTISSFDDAIAILSSSNNNTLSNSNVTASARALGVWSSSNNNIITNSNLTGGSLNSEGIRFDSSSNNQLINITLKGYGSGYPGISFTSSSNNNTIINSNVTSTSNKGISISSSLNNQLISLIVNGNVAVSLTSSNNTLITGSNLTTTAFMASGIIYSFSNNNTLSNSNISANSSATISMSSSHNNNFLNLNVLGFYSGISMSSSNNTLINNSNINATGTGVAMGSLCNYNIVSNSNITATTSQAISISASSNNLLLNNIVSSSTWDFYSSSNSQNNTITNLSLQSANLSFTSLDIALDALTSGKPTDTVGLYNISKYINMTNTSASSWAFVNISYDDLDIPSDIDEITLKLYRYNITSSAWEVIPESGVNTASNYVYGNITSFSIFAPMGEESTNLTACKSSGWTENQTYYLIQNVSSEGTCMNITANNVTLDCDGYIINYSQSSDGYGIDVVGYNFITIKNCNIVTGSDAFASPGIHLNSNNSVVEFNNITTYGINMGIYGDNSYSDNILNNNIVTYSEGANGMYLIEIYDSNIAGNNITTSGSSSPGIELYGSSNNLTNNEILTGESYGIYLAGSNNIFENDTVYSSLGWDFYSELDSQNNIVTNLFLRSANISFTSLDIALDALTSDQPADSNGLKNISKYINMTNNSASSWAFMNISYKDSDISSGVSESSLKLYEYNESDWIAVNSSGVNTTKNYVYGNITSFSIFAPMGEESTNLTDCKQSGWNENQTYYLIQNVSSEGTCMIIDADNVTIDCQGYQINYSQSNDGYSIDVTGYNFITIKNCNIVTGSDAFASPGIHLNSNNSVVESNNITTYGINMGIYGDNSYSDNLLNNNIVTFGDGANGMYLIEIYDSNIANNNISTLGFASPGIELYGSSNNLTNNEILAEGESYGIYLAGSDNIFENDTVYSSFGWDFYSELDSQNNIVTNLFLRSANISFTSLDIALDALTSDQPADSNGLKNISKYINMTNNAGGSWAYVNISYKDSDIPSGVSESSLKLYEYNESDWIAVNDSGVNTTANYVYGNITSFSIFAPMGMVSHIQSIYPYGTPFSNTTIFEFANISLFSNNQTNIRAIYNSSFLFNVTIDLEDAAYNWTVDGNVSSNLSYLSTSLAEGMHNVTVIVGGIDNFTWIVNASQTQMLGCYVSTSCGAGYGDIFHMSDLSNAHAELGNQTDYSYKVCCKEVSGNAINNNCSGIKNETILHLSDVTNAHAEIATQSDYSYDVCLNEVAGFNSINCNYLTDCLGYDTCVASISGDTNAHVGDCFTDPYTTKVCCSESTCVPDCSCAATLCNIDTCSDGCGGLCVGDIVPNCAGRNCGFDTSGCGTSCGTCTDPQTCNVTIGVCFTPPIAPVIESVSAIPAQNPNEGSTKAVTFSVVVYDGNGASDVNVANATFSKASESDKFNSCSKVTDIDANRANFSCSIDMQYYDSPGAWGVSVTVRDSTGLMATNNSTSFTYNEMTAFTISPSTIYWSTIALGDTDKQASNATTVNNTGNTNFSLQIKAFDLAGYSYPIYSMLSSNFAVSIDSNPSCSGDTLQNSYYVSINDSSMVKGPLSTKEINYCLKNVSMEQERQVYTTEANGAWIIKVVIALAIIIPVRRKKKLKEIRKDLMDYMLQTVSSLRDKYDLSLEEISELIKSERMKEEAIMIPLPIFTFSELGPAESLVKYMKENLGMKFSEIARVLNRDDRTIWITYSHAKKKMPAQIDISRLRKKLFIPISILSDRRLSLLESVVKFLKEKNIGNIEIAALLHKDPRNIYTFYSRMKKKLLL